jgi:hypothetical protein
VNLNNVSVSTATREVCDDRTNLVDRGLGPVTSFAYPYAAANSTSQSVVESCGYASGRGVGSLRDDCGGCLRQTVPPPTRTGCGPPYAT